MSKAAAAEEPQFPTSGVNPAVYAFIRSLPDLHGKVVVDIPAGDGRASHEFRKKGAVVKAFDLFPEFMQAPGVTAEYGNMSEPLPLADDSVDYVICQEGIEHIPDQPGLLAEFNRVLKKGGWLLLTTPNLSHVRSRLSWFLFETDFWRRMPPTELDSIWFGEGETDRIYYGHLFLLGVHQLQALCSMAGFSAASREKSYLSVTSLILGVPLFPLFLLSTLWTYRTYSRKSKKIPKETRRRIWWEHVRLNLSATTLFHKHIFWVLEKEQSIEEKRRELINERFRTS